MPRNDIWLLMLMHFITALGRWGNEYRTNKQITASYECDTVVCYLYVTSCSQFDVDESVLGVDGADTRFIHTHLLRIRITIGHHYGIPYMHITNSIISRMA